MRRFIVFFSACALACGPASAQGILQPQVLDLTPEWLDENVKQRVLESLVDPDSAKIEWKYTTSLQDSVEKIKGADGKRIKTKVQFAVTCGTVNARNRMGGYTGNQFVIVALWPDRLVMNIEDDMAGGGMCSDYVHRGIVTLR